MVIKKVSLLSIIAIAMGVATVFVGLSGHTAFALEGNFKWTAPDTIVADGYSQSGAVTFKGAPPNLKSTETITKRSSNINSAKGCTFNATITVDMNNTSKAQVVAQDVNNSFLDACDKDDLSGDITLADVNKGPQAANTINYATANCADNAKNGGDAAKCNAIKACIGTVKPQADCLTAFNTCISNHTADGNIPAPDRQACIDNVTKGDLAAANAPVTDAQDKTTCAIDGVGWIICPVVNFLAKMVNGAYAFVASLLTVQPLLTTGQTQGVYEAWSMMRNFANVAFVIVFLIIIFSQVTSIGISNYGLKKLLPKLVVGAILVNVSYWICAIAVDLSNISGASIIELFKSLNAALATPNAGAFGAQGDGWIGIAEGILSGTLVAGIALYVTLSAFLPILIAALLAIFTVFLVLTLRQALIILLVVISPLVFVAYLLPNTENLSKKARDLFETLLVMYPIISLIFGASALASTIVMATASGPYKIAIQSMGAGIAIIPLAITPLVMKTAGGVLNRFGGFFNNPNKGAFDRMKKGAERYAGRRKNIAQDRRLRGTNVFREGRFGQERIRSDGSSRGRRIAAKVLGGAVTAAAPVSGVVNWRSRAQMNTDLKTQNAEKALAQTKQDYVADRIASEMKATGSSKYAQTIAGPTGDVNRIQMAAIAAKKNEVAQAIKDAQISANIPPGDVAEMGRRMAEAVSKNDDITARAMQNMLLTSGSAGLKQYRDSMSSVENTVDPNTGAGQALRENLLDNHSNVKAAANDLIQQAVSGRKMSEVASDPNTWKLPDDELVHQKTDSIKIAIASGAIAPEQATRIADNEELAKHLHPEVRAQINRIAGRP